MPVCWLEFLARSRPAFFDIIRQIVTADWPLLGQQLYCRPRNCCQQGWKCHPNVCCDPASLVGRGARPLSELTEPATNETLRSIYRRHSVRHFTDQEVREEDLSTILAAANCAPSAHNQQSWRFIVLRGQKKHDLAGLVTERAADFPRPSSILLRMASRSIISAPWWWPWPTPAN